MFATKHTKKTSRLVFSLINLKSEELILCEQKATHLKKLINNKPQNVTNHYKLKMTKLRCEQLQKTIQNLIQLEEKIESLKNFQENLG